MIDLLPSRSMLIAAPRSRGRGLGLAAQSQAGDPDDRGSVIDHTGHIEKMLFLFRHLGARAPLSEDAGEQSHDVGARTESPVVVEVQRDERGRATGALHLALSSLLTIERDGAGNIIGVKPRDI